MKDKFLPTHPKLGSGAVHLWGPSPSEGKTFAIYECSCNSDKWVMSESAHICPVCGQEMVKLYNAKTPVIAAAFNEQQKSLHRYTCKSCGEDFWSNLPTDHFVCASCGVMNELAEDEIPEEEEETPAPEEEMPEEETPTPAEEDLQQPVEVLDQTVNLQYEPLADPSEIENITEADVVMVYYEDPEKGPFYNVEIRGMPVGRIELNSLPNKDKVQDIFSSESFRSAVIKSLVEKGVMAAMEEFNGVLWVAPTNPEAVQEAVFASLYSDIDNYKTKWLDRISIAVAGYDKNIWQDEHPAKNAIFDAFKATGYFNSPDPEEQAKLDAEVWKLTEKAWAVGGYKFIEAIFEKAEELMDKPDSYIKAMQEIIGEVKVLNPFNK